jgi:hypothetical protein
VKGAKIHPAAMAARKVALPAPPQAHAKTPQPDKVRFPDSGAIGAAPAVQTPVGRI